MTKDEAVILIGIVGLAISIFVIVTELGTREYGKFKAKTNQNSKNKEAQKENKPPVA